MKNTRVESCRLVELPRFSDQRGSLSFVEGQNHIPFEIKRVFYLYDIHPQQSRGSHAHKELHQFLICLGGSVEVILKDGRSQKSLKLSSPSSGLHIPPGIWAEQTQFTKAAVCLVLASEKFLESDYIRNYQDFIEYKKGN